MERKEQEKVNFTFLANVVERTGDAVTIISPIGALARAEAELSEIYDTRAIFTHALYSNLPDNRNSRLYITFAPEECIGKEIAYTKFDVCDRHVRLIRSVRASITLEEIRDDGNLVLRLACEETDDTQPNA